MNAKRRSTTNRFNLKASKKGMTMSQLRQGTAMHDFCNLYLEHTGATEDFLPGRLLWRTITTAAGIPENSRFAFRMSREKLVREITLKYGLRPQHSSRHQYDGDPQGQEDMVGRVVQGWTGIRLNAAGYALIAEMRKSEHAC